MRCVGVGMADLSEMTYTCNELLSFEVEYKTNVNHLQGRIPILSYLAYFQSLMNFKLRF